MNVILFGPPGVGKGTTASILSSHYHVPHISTGEILRSAIKNETELGKKAKAEVERGGLVSDEIVTEIVKNELSKVSSNGFILNGYPRTIEQAKALSAFSQINHVLNLSAPKKVILERIKSRSEGRVDDDPTIITQRWTEYEEKTAPLLDFYRNEGILSDIDSTQDVEGVADQCKQVLDGDE